MSWRLDPRQLLWVCPEKPADALWAAEQILRNGSCGALLCWLPQVRPESLRRLHLAAQASDLLFVALRPSAAAAHATPALAAGAGAAPGGLSVHILAPGPACDTPLHVGLEPGASKHPPAMRLWIAACLRCLPLDAIRPHWPDDAQAYAVLEQERVIVLTPAARLAGVRLDMRRAGAAAIAPQVELLPRSPQAEADALQGAAALALLHTRLRSRWPTRPPCCWAWAPACNFPPARTGAPGRRHVAGAGLAGVAGHGAHRRRRLAAGAAPRTARLPAGADPAHARSQVRRVPLALLPRRGRAWTGCRTSAAPRWATCALPRAGSQRRSAPELLAALDAAYGLAPEPQRWIEPPARFARRIELMEYLEHTDAVLAVARRLAEQLGGWLAASQLAVRKITLSLEHERGAARAHRAGTGAVATSLAAGADPRPAAREAGPHDADRPGHRRGPVGAETVAQPAASATLFPEPGGTAEDQARLLDLLSARLGRERVRRARPQADHRPEAANAWGDALQAPAGAEPLPALLDRPFWLLDPPQPLRLAGDRPQYRGQALRLMRGPERIESGWWDPQLTVRDYFVAEDEAAARYWIYRERDAEHARWFLHGLYA